MSAKSAQKRSGLDRAPGLVFFSVFLFLCLCSFFAFMSGNDDLGDTFARLAWIPLGGWLLYAIVKAAVRAANKD